ncbi:MAG TPA: DNA glycosylase [Chthoniobacterales bacterium]|jgi:N-glycosylase/DNA lyase
MSVIAAPEFDLRMTLESGQVFHWQREDDAWCGVIGATAVRVAQRGDMLEVTDGCEALVARYFALDHPLPEIRATFPEDAFSRAALASCRGLRVMRQPRWECLATFLTSAMKQVSHIRGMSLALRARFGEPVAGSAVNAYPAPAALAAASEAELRGCGLGFRAPNLRATARRIADGEVDLEVLAGLPTAELLTELCALPGVGRKIANCALLFAYERLESVPVDVWIARVTRAMAPRGGDASLAELEAFSRERFGRYAGYVQQYLFHHARVSKTLPTS